MLTRSWHRFVPLAIRANRVRDPGSGPRRLATRLSQILVRAVIMTGLNDGEMVVLEGIQRVRPGIQVTPGPAAPTPAAPRSVGQ